MDRRKSDTTVPTLTLIMWLDFIVAVGGGASVDREQGTRDAVMGHFARVHEELTARDEEDERQRGA
jgi:hypothetical protein